MAASISTKIFILVSRPSAAIVPRITPLTPLLGENFVFRICGVRFCSNFKTKAAVTNGQTDTDFVDGHDLSDHADEQPRVQEPPPIWKMTRRYLAKQYAKQGKASGVDPSIMWPTQTELENIIKDEEEWCPSLQQMQSEIAEENHAIELKRKKREQLIAANMAKMPRMLAEHRKKMTEKEALAQEQIAKRNRLLEEAKEKLGYAIDPRSTRFQKMVQEIEKEERKKKKELKKKGIIV
ncbi:growth arrest and DNA damage-inducible proteins-interacting protein 1-like [Patiria miniata]|uniref:Large ribosomal subunit protein mL64 n=1 Tax=Patiria miniata TaxID=46514 RepID=A0A914A0D5_PATMI|nr:growth arrest and DNA damage-inducible proteins-interacting protein 1-like [Patiria miniata]